MIEYVYESIYSGTDFPILLGMAGMWFGSGLIFSKIIFLDFPELLLNLLEKKIIKYREKKKV